MLKKSIVYLNYFPYENSGHILEFLLENFERVYVLSIAFHTIGKKSVNKFTVYEKGKLIKEEEMFSIAIPQNLVFIFIPLRSLINAIQIFWKLISLKKNFGTIDVFFTVNAFTAAVGRVLKNLGIVRETIFWVWDYYPINHASMWANVLRYIYWQFDKYATFSDRVIYLHKRIAEVRKEKGVIDKNEKVIIVPIGTGKMLPVKKKNFKHIKIGFIGVLKKTQGVTMIVNSAEVLSKYFDSLSFEIIGSGPDEKIFKKAVKRNKKVKYNFHGLVSESKFEETLYSSTIGISPYSLEEGSVSKYTDPGKPKRYMECNLPIITTDVIEISKEIKKSGAGEIVKYNDFEGLAEVIKKIITSYDQYVGNVVKLHKKYYYKDIYPVMFGIK